jgi:hypothetical protein
MNRQRNTLMLSLIALISVNSFSQPPARQFFVAIDGLAPAVKFGMEKNISERFSLKGSAGFCLVGPSLLSYNFFASYKLTKPEKAFGVNINVGFLDNYIEVISPMFSLGLGGGLESVIHSGITRD